MRLLLVKQQVGFGIVEMMVAIVIALVSSLVIFETFAVSEGIKRTSTSGSDAQQNGSAALYMIEREARMAGYGINNQLLLGCTVRYYDKNGTGVPATLTLAPVVITPGATPADSDRVTLMFGDSDLFANPARLIQNMPSPSATYKVDNRFGFSEGDLVIAAESGLDCTLAEVTNVPGTTGQSDNVIHNPGNYQVGKDTVSSRYNRPGGLGVSYTTNGRLFNLGKAPTQDEYRIEANRLVAEHHFGNLATDIVGEQIVQLKAQYGKDDGVNNGTVTNVGAFTANDGLVDSYSNVAPATPAAWRQVMSL